jgi:ABC-type nitrate/sulfonate/bicarbonate transport system substrate-binding protein
MRPFIILLLLLSFQVLRAEELKKVTLQLSWFDQFQFAGYYIAKEKGFYKDLGLDVEIKPFAFGINVPNEVDEGRADFGVGRETLILDRAKGKKIVALCALFQATPLILLTSNDSNINKVEDFVNKKIMTTSDDSSEVSIKAMISSKKK